MERVYRLGLGEVGPLQQSSVSCGAACLAVARMMRDPQTATWVVQGLPGDGRSPDERFADLERAIMRRTNSVMPSPGRWQLPWPKELGTSPWGALAELEARVADPGTTYRLIIVRGMAPHALERVFDDVIARTRSGEPALLYVGSPLLPRHVCLLFADDRDKTVLLYEPATGAVALPSRDAFTTGQLGLGGWDRPWCLIAAGTRAARVVAEHARVLPAPTRLHPGTAMMRDAEPGSA